MKKDKSVEIVRERELQGWARIAFSSIAVLFGLFHLYYSTIGITTTMTLRSGHLLLVLLLGFLLYPSTRKSTRTSSVNKPTVLDMIFMGLAVASGTYIIVMYPTLVWRLGITTKLDIFFALIDLIIIIELTRRMVGITLPIIASLSIIYALMGPYFPGILSHKGYDFPRVMSQLYLTLEGIYSVALGVMVSYVYLFILFGIIFLKTGGADLFVKLSLALTGHLRGGPAKTAVIGSALMASISGSSSANIVTTGSFTIPMMKKMGFKPEVAAGIETAASAGGLIMPPVMGAGAFIMAEWTGHPYREIIMVAAIPAMLYLFSVYCFVNIRVNKMKIGRMQKKDLPKVTQVLKRHGHFIIPMAVLVYTLIKGYSPVMAALTGIFSLIGISMIKKESRLGLRGWIDTFVLAGKTCIIASMASACAGILIGIVGLTGVGLKFSSMVMTASFGNIFLAIGLIGLASLVLGMGLPVTVAYITLAILAGPGLMELGIPMLTAHLIIFWFSQDSQVTPPVCIPAYQAAALAHAAPMKTGVEAWKIAKGLYLIPFLMAYTNILLNGTLWEIVRSAISSALALFILSSILERYLITKTRVSEFTLLCLALLAALWPSVVLNILGGCLVGVVFIMQRHHAKTYSGTPAVIREVKFTN